MQASTKAASARTRIALVTGANKGIGYAIVEKLAEERSLTVLLGARDVKRGEDAIKQIGKSNVSLLKLDVDSEESVKAAAASVKSQYGGLDILVNNAGRAWKGDAFNENVARTTLQTNYYGTLYMMRHFQPLMREGGRIVNVSSMVAQSSLKRMSAALRNQFLDPKLNEQKLTALAEKFVDDVKMDRVAAEGWPRTTYGVSKVCMSMLTIIAARDNTQRGLLINSCCPGWVRTDMAGPNASKSPAEGADTPVYLALLPPDATVTGAFFQDRNQQPL